MSVGRCWQVVDYLDAGGYDEQPGYQTAILDADVTGPSIPKAFGITEKATGNNQGLLPVKT